MSIGKIVSSAEYRMDEQFQNFQFLELNFDFPNWQKSRNFLTRSGYRFFGPFSGYRRLFQIRGMLKRSINNKKIC